MPVDLNFAATIPVIDMTDYHNFATRHKFLQGLDRAFRTVGFVAVINSDVNTKILDAAYKSAQDFYAKPLEYKLQANDPEINGQRGYVQSEVAQGQKAKDYKEFYHIGKQYSSGIINKYGYKKNIWVDQDCDFKVATLRLLTELNKYTDVINEAIAMCVGLEKSFFNNMTEHGDSLLRSLHYPANPPKDTVWAAAHTDIDLYTILPRSTADGLQVKTNRGWVDVKVPDGAFIINAGDMLQNLTNGIYKSSIHRVISKGHDERFSMVYFVHPMPFANLSPLSKYIAEAGKTRYPRANARELLFIRLAELGLHKSGDGLLEFIANSGIVSRMQEVGVLPPIILDKLKEEGLSTREYLSRASKHSKRARLADF